MRTMQLPKKVNQTLRTTLAVCAFWVISCSQTQKQVGDDNEIPADFSIRFGEGGGFTGLWQGYTINTDGTILSWQGRVEGENAKPVGKLSRDQLRSMWQKIRRMDYFSQQQEQKGNMTMIMQITANNTTHTVSWVSGSEQATAATSNLRELRRFCDAIIETVKKSSEK